jgi:hypothetical protein
MEDRGLASRLRDRLFGHDPAELPLEALVERGQGGRQRRCGFGEGDAEDVCLDRLRVLRAELDPHVAARCYPRGFLACGVEKL